MHWGERGKSRIGTPIHLRDSQDRQGGSFLRRGGYEKLPAKHRLRRTGQQLGRSLGGGGQTHKEARWGRERSRSDTNTSIDGCPGTMRFHLPPLCHISVCVSHAILGWHSSLNDATSVCSSATTAPPPPVDLVPKWENGPMKNLLAPPPKSEWPVAIWHLNIGQRNGGNGMIFFGKPGENFTLPCTLLVFAKRHPAAFILLFSLLFPCAFFLASEGCEVRSWCACMSNTDRSGDR